MRNQGARAKWDAKGHWKSLYGSRGVESNYISFFEWNITMLRAKKGKFNSQFRFWSDTTHLRTTSCSSHFPSVHLERHFRYINNYNSKNCYSMQRIKLLLNGYSEEHCGKRVKTSVSIEIRNWIHFSVIKVK